MKMRTIAKKSIVAMMICGGFAAVRPAEAFVWPVTDISQIGAFVTNINSGISEVKNTKSQIENAMETINSVGDQAATMAKFTADLTGSSARVGDIDLSAMKTDEYIKKTTKKTNDDADKTRQTNITLADVTVENVNLQISNGATSEEIKDTINDAKNEVLTQNEEMSQSYDKAEEEIGDIADNVIEQLKGVVNYLDEQTHIEVAQAETYKKTAENLIKQAENIKETAQSIIRNAKLQLNSEYTSNIMKSFDEYNQSAQDYQTGKITEEEFKQAGERLKQNISSNNIGIDLNDISQLINTAQQITESAKKLQENILNSQSNNKEYSDDESEKLSSNISIDTSIKYSFQYRSVNQNAFAKEIYFNTDLDEEYQTFIISKELVCHKLKEKNLKELEKYTTKFSECITLAKTEKDYICLEKRIDVDDKRCDPYKLEPKDLYAPFKKDGVYDHIVEDYSVANIQNNARNQQFADSWMRGDSSVYNELVKQIEDGARVSTTKNAYEFIGLIDLEGPKLWNKLRTVDTLHRSKIATQQFSRGKSLYLDKRDSDFVKAYKEKPGLMKNIETLKGKEDRQLVSNIFPYYCNKKAEDFSVDPKDKYNKNEIKNVEKNIAKCLFTYAAPASGHMKSKTETYCGKDFTVQQCSEIWLKNIQQAINDSSFQTITLATINNYQSAKDYEENLSANETNIKTLEDKAKEAQDARDGYASGAQINYYETVQILGIVDADAQNLQTEILSFLPEIDYNFFDIEFNEE